MDIQAEIDRIAAGAEQDRTAYEEEAFILRFREGMRSQAWAHCSGTLERRIPITDWNYVASLCADAATAMLRHYLSGRA
jgi:hypothetical protein